MDICEWQRSRYSICLHIDFPYHSALILIPFWFKGDLPLSFLAASFQPPNRLSISPLPDWFAKQPQSNNNKSQPTNLRIKPKDIETLPWEPSILWKPGRPIPSPNRPTPPVVRCVYAQVQMRAYTFLYWTFQGSARGPSIIPLLPIWVQQAFPFSCFFESMPAIAIRPGFSHSSGWSTFNINGLLSC